MVFSLFQVKWEVTQQQRDECRNKGKDPEVGPVLAFSILNVFRRCSHCSLNAFTDRVHELHQDPAPDGG